MEVYSMSFDGALLERGFWLYIWDIKTLTERYLYVGRTGDSSSPNAAFPFARIGQHLDVRPNARANSIARRLKEKNVLPSSGKFEMLAIGPLFLEQATLTDHKVYRDQMAALERDLAKYLRESGYNVLGTHASRKSVNEKMLTKVLKIVKKRFPPALMNFGDELSLISSSLSRQAGVACLKNARALLSEAKMLYEKGFFARSFCLAIIGQEELGKAIIFALAGLDLFPGLRERLSNRNRSNPAFEHELKQILEESWGIAIWQVEEYHKILIDEIGRENWTPISDVEWLEELFVSLAIEDPSCTDVLRKQGRAKKIMKKWTSGVFNELTTEEQKHTGFYVDLKPDRSISEPDSIDEIDARIGIGKLDSALEDFKRLDRVFTNDEDWNRLKERLKKRMT